MLEARNEALSSGDGLIGQFIREAALENSGLMLDDLNLCKLEGIVVTCSQLDLAHENVITLYNPNTDALNGFLLSLPYEYRDVEVKGVNASETICPKQFLTFQEVTDVVCEVFIEY